VLTLSLPFVDYQAHPLAYRQAVATAVSDSLYGSRVAVQPGVNASTRTAFAFNLLVTTSDTTTGDTATEAAYAGGLVSTLFSDDAPTPGFADALAAYGLTAVTLTGGGCGGTGCSGPGDLGDLPGSVAVSLNVTFAAWYLDFADASYVVAYASCVLCGCEAPHTATATLSGVAGEGTAVYDVRFHSANNSALVAALVARHAELPDVLPYATAASLVGAVESAPPPPLASWGVQAVPVKLQVSGATVSDFEASSGFQQAFLAGLADALALPASLVGESPVHGDDASCVVTVAFRAVNAEDAASLPDRVAAALPGAVVAWRSYGLRVWKAVLLSYRGVSL
jgi:hypothetical protein